MLAECEAKKAIVERAREKSHLSNGIPPLRYVTDPGWPWLLKLLALPYADHPDYQEEAWKP